MKKITIILTVLLLSACSPPVTHISTTVPSEHSILAQRVFLIDQGKKATWDDLLSMFANSEFNINKLNMNAYQIKLQMGGRPDLYIDCGRKKINTEDHIVTVVNARKNYTYRAYKRNHLETFSVSNTFTGHVNLIITGDQMNSKVMVQYTLDLQTEENKTTTRGQKYNTKKQEKIEISGTQPVRSNLLKTTCRSTGALEQKVVELLSLIPHFVSLSAPIEQPN